VFQFVQMGIKEVQLLIHVLKLLLLTITQIIILQIITIITDRHQIHHQIHHNLEMETPVQELEQ